MPLGPTPPNGRSSMREVQQRLVDVRPPETVRSSTRWTRLESSSK